MTVPCLLNTIFALANELKAKNKDNLDLSISCLFSASEPKDFDLSDESGQPLFARAMATLGPLTSDEIYGFEPALALGGKMLLENLARIKLDVHLTILRQLATPTLPLTNLDIDKLIGR